MELFTKATGKPFVVGVSWMFWETCVAADFERFRKYIRPSHQKILDEAIAGTAENPCSLLRQLLRPHNYTIRRGSRNWSLQIIKGKGEEGSAEDDSTSPRASIITLDKPTTIEWV